MVQFFKVLFVVTCLCAFSSAAITYEINYKRGVPSISDKKIEQMVSDALNLDKSTAPYYRSLVNVYARDSREDTYFVVYLYRSDSYTVTSFLLEVKDSRVVTVMTGYVEESREEDVCGTCPDQTVEVLISYLEDALFPGAIQHGQKAYTDALAAGKKVALLIGIAETKSAVTNYLTCPKLRIWGRIGHGSTSTIQLNDRTNFTTSDISKNAQYINGKTFVFNSCLCHNDPFEPAMKSAGAYFFAAGDISLSGGREGVFSSFCKKAIAGKMELTQAMTQAVSENNYPNAWGYSGAGQAPYYLTFGQTGISNSALPAVNTVTIKATGDKVLFQFIDPSSPVSQISIFNSLGMLVYRDMISTTQSSWDLTLTNRQKIATGNYIAVYTSQTGSVKKAFTVVH